MTPARLCEVIRDLSPEWRERIDFLPKSHVEAICKAAIDGEDESEIIQSNPMGGEDFDYSALLADLASLATLYCAVLETISHLSKAGRRTSSTEEILRDLPPRHRSKSEVEMVVSLAIRESTLASNNHDDV